MIILGIDPGSTRVGYGVIEKNGGFNLIDYGVIQEKQNGDYKNIVSICDKIEKIIKKYKPVVAGLETLYFSKNKKTALSVSEARGAIILTLIKNKIGIKEFNYNDVKSVVTGSGSNDKEMVRRVVAMTLGVKKIKGYDDSADALAIALRTAFEHN